MTTCRCSANATTSSRRNNITPRAPRADGTNSPRLTAARTPLDPRYFRAAATSFVVSQSNELTRMTRSISVRMTVAMSPAKFSSPADASNAVEQFVVAPTTPAWSNANASARSSPTRASSSESTNYSGKRPISELASDPGQGFRDRQRFRRSAFLGASSLRRSFKMNGLIVPNNDSRTATSARRLHSAASSHKRQQQTGSPPISHCESPRGYETMNARKAHSYLKMADEAPTRPTTLALTDPIRAALAEAAKDECASPSRLARQILSEALSARGYLARVSAEVGPEQ